jgi:GTPase SAR1 family protein
MLMPQSSNMTPARTVARGALRLVIFGMPAAGKSSLLGALAQAAKTQEQALSGHLIDLSGGLTELQRRVYEGQPRETLEEVVPYPVVLETLLAESQAPGQSSLEAILIDCDGRVAQDLVTRRQSLAENVNTASLASAVLEADTLILAIDASATTEQLDDTFAQFGRFLRLLEYGRGQRSAVAGLPVFLVLTKSDLLAGPGDTSALWKDRIEERKRQVGAHFQEFLARTRAAGGTPFGSVDLRVWATAVRHPALADTPAKPLEPYGVAELFRQAVSGARGFKQRSRRAASRLLWTVAGVVLLTAGMLGLAGFLVLHRAHDDPGVRELLAKVENYRSREPLTPSNRLRGQLQLRISELTELQSDANFARLPPDKQRYVNQRLREAQDYRAYYDQLQALPSLNEIHSERDLQALEDRLQRLLPSAEHRADWAQTDAVTFRGERLEAIKAVRQAVSAEETRYKAWTRRGQELWTFANHKEGTPLPWSDWAAQVRALFNEAQTAARPDERVPGTPLSREAILGVDRVAAARSDWDAIKQRLLRVSNLSTALGLGRSQPGRSPLDIPADFALSQAATRFAELKSAYPQFQSEFSLLDLPEAIVGEIRPAAKIRYGRLLKAGREIVLHHLQQTLEGKPESLESWRRLLPWLEGANELVDWNVLATILARLQDPEAEAPLGALIAFIRQEQFDLLLPRLILQIADATNVKPAGKLVVHYQKSAESSQEQLTFELTGETRHDAKRGVALYTLKPSASANLTYRPGELLWADLPVKLADQADRMLTWAASRSRVYQFERLIQPPRLHTREQPNLEGQIEENIALQIPDDGRLPRLPDLLPVVPSKPD